MITTHHHLNDNAWTKIATGEGSKIIRREASGEALLHIGKTSPSVESLAFVTASRTEEFTLPAGISVWARARSGSAEIVVIG